MSVAVVTGASQGIGQATAIALARAGADVAGSYRPHCDEQERTSAAETVAAVEALGKRCVLVEVDAGDPAPTTSRRLPETSSAALTSGSTMPLGCSYARSSRPPIRTGPPSWARM